MLVLRYTLAYQRDVSSADQENAFCVSMLNGSMNVSHKWQTVTGADKQACIEELCNYLGVPSNF